MKHELKLLSDESGEEYYIMDEKAGDLVSGPHSSETEAWKAIVGILEERHSEECSEIWQHYHRVEDYCIKLIEMLEEVSDRTCDEDGYEIASVLKKDYDRTREWYTQAKDFIVEGGNSPIEGDEDQ